MKTTRKVGLTLLLALVAGGGCTLDEGDSGKQLEQAVVTKSGVVTAMRIVSRAGTTKARWMLQTESEDVPLIFSEGDADGSPMGLSPGMRVDLTGELVEGRLVVERVGSKTPATPTAPNGIVLFSPVLFAEDCAAGGACQAPWKGAFDVKKLGDVAVDHVNKTATLGKLALTVKSSLPQQLAGASGPMSKSAACDLDEIVRGAARIPRGAADVAPSAAGVAHWVLVYPAHCTEIARAATLGPRLVRDIGGKAGENRLVSIAWVPSSGPVLEADGTTPTAAGRRVEIDAAQGLVRAYGIDASGSLRCTAHLGSDAADAPCAHEASDPLSLAGTADLNGTSLPDLSAAAKVAAGFSQATTTVTRATLRAQTWTLAPPGSASNGALHEVRVERDRRTGAAYGGCYSFARSGTGALEVRLLSSCTGPSTSTLLVGPSGTTVPGGVVVDDYDGLLSYSLSGASLSIAPIAEHVSTNAGSYAAGVLAPDAIAAAFGTDLASSTIQGGVPLPTELGGTRVEILSGGRVTPAEIFFVSPGQVNFKVPSTTPLSEAAQIRIRTPRGQSIEREVAIRSAAPSLFTADASGVGAAAGAMYVVVADALIPPVSLARVEGGKTLPAEIRLGPGDSAVAALYGTGVRTARTVTATIDNVAAPILFRGPQPDYAGLDQINVSVPASVYGRGLVELRVFADGEPSNPVLLDLRDPQGKAEIRPLASNEFAISVFSRQFIPKGLPGAIANGRVCPTTPAGASAAWSTEGLSAATRKETLPENGESLTEALKYQLDQYRFSGDDRLHSLAPSGPVSAGGVTSKLVVEFGGFALASAPAPGALPVPGTVRLDGTFRSSDHHSFRFLHEFSAGCLAMAARAPITTEPAVPSIATSPSQSLMVGAGYPFLPSPKIWNGLNVDGGRLLAPGVLAFEVRLLRTNFPFHEAILEWQGKRYGLAKLVSPCQGPSIRAFRTRLVDKIGVVLDNHTKRAFVDGVEVRPNDESSWGKTRMGDPNRCGYFQ